MVEIEIPGYRRVELRHLVMDYNGTLACEGRLVSGVKEAIETLAHSLRIHIVTADTFGKATTELRDLPAILQILPEENQAEGKLQYVRQLGSESVVAVGNGRNDRLMLKEAALGIAVVLDEGAAVETLQSADIVCKDILSALALLTNPRRLVATLRS